MADSAVTVPLGLKAHLVQHFLARVIKAKFTSHGHVTVMRSSLTLAADRIFLRLVKILACAPSL